MVSIIAFYFDKPSSNPVANLINTIILNYNSRVIHTVGKFVVITTLES